MRTVKGDKWKSCDIWIWMVSTTHRINLTLVYGYEPCHNSSLSLYTARPLSMIAFGLTCMNSRSHISCWYCFCSLSTVKLENIKRTWLIIEMFNPSIFYHHLKFQKKVTNSNKFDNFKRKMRNTRFCDLEKFNCNWIFWRFLPIDNLFNG